MNTLKAKGYTLKSVNEVLVKYGMMCKKIDGEYQVDFKGKKTDSRYYTDDLGDACITGLAMSGEWNAEKQNIQDNFHE